jgi:hypothetical protein
MLETSEFSYTWLPALERRLRRQYLLHHNIAYVLSLCVVSICSLLLSYGKEFVWIGGVGCGFAAASWWHLRRGRRAAWTRTPMEVRVRIADDRLHIDSEEAGLSVPWNRIRRVAAKGDFIYLYVLGRREPGIALPRAAVPAAALQLIEQRAAAAALPPVERQSAATRS